MTLAICQALCVTGFFWSSDYALRFLVGALRKRKRVAVSEDARPETDHSQPQAYPSGRSEYQPNSSHQGVLGPTVMRSCSCDKWGAAVVKPTGWLDLVYLVSALEIIVRRTTATVACFSDLLTALSVEETANRIMASVHAFTAWGFGLSAFVYSDVSSWHGNGLAAGSSFTGSVNECGNVITPLQRGALIFSLGYFLYDIVKEIQKSASYPMLLHHAAACVGLMAGLKYNRSGTELLGSIFAAEISTPLYHLRAFLKPLRASPGYRFLFALVTYLFAGVFIVVRCAVAGPYITWCSVTASQSPILVKFSGCTVYVLSLYWAYLMLRMCVKPGSKKAL